MCVCVCVCVHMRKGGGKDCLHLKQTHNAFLVNCSDVMIIMKGGNKLPSIPTLHSIMTYMLVR